MPVAGLYGAKGISSKEAEKRFNEAVNLATKSSDTAKKIWGYLSSGNRMFDVIVLWRDMCFGQMLTEYDKTSDDAKRARDCYEKVIKKKKIERPVVLWNPDYIFVYYGDVKGVTLLDNGDVRVKTAKERAGEEYILRYEWLNDTHKVCVVQATRGDMPREITLFHELGHVRQYFEEGAKIWNEMLNNVANIEKKNLEDHENPICKEYGIPVRKHYKHQKACFKDIAKKYSIAKKIQKACRISTSRSMRLVDDYRLRKCRTVGDHEIAEENFPDLTSQMKSELR